MIYNFKCDNCGHLQDEENPIVIGPPDEVFCDHCGEKMSRIWGSSIYIPEYFKATSDEVSPSDVGRLINSRRPSGKRKIYY